MRVRVHSFWIQAKKKVKEFGMEAEEMDVKDFSMRKWQARG